MTLRRLERKEWLTYFDEFSHKLKEGATLSLEIVGPEIGDQREIDSQELTGLSHDPKTDRFNVFISQMGHSIPHPREIYVQEEEGFPRYIAIIDEEENKQVLTIRGKFPTK